MVIEQAYLPESDVSDVIITLEQCHLQLHT